MEIEYSNEVRGKVYAYRFSEFEKKHIADSLKTVIKKMELKIEKIRNHPKNEGQATYACQIDDIQKEIASLKEIVKEFGAIEAR